jgi:hypothetical protein
MLKKNNKSVPVEKTDNQFPLFFKAPAVLDAARHAKAVIRADQGYEFAKKINSIPLNAAELMLAAKFYPIVFTGDKNPVPCAIVGLEQDNYFVSDKGEWKAGSYIPSYVRKYPFAFTEFPEAKQLTLCVDEGAKHYLAEGIAKVGSKLFEAGKPTKFTQNALEFCTAFHNHFVLTQKFVTEIKKAGLLVQNQSEAQLYTGRKIQLGGFFVIDQEKFNALPDAKIAEFRKNGWLPLIYFCLQSASNWKNLVDMAAKVEKPRKTAK